MHIEPLTLDGSFIRLKPLTLDHSAALCTAGLAGDVFRWFPVIVRTADDMRAYIEAALREQAAGASLPFVTIEKQHGTPIGSTRYLNIDGRHRRLEIGSTWLAPAWQRTPANTEAKYLLLQHAFEQLGCIRVEFKTDALNERSRAALLRIGAQEEGTLRNHMVTSTGRIRHSVYYSIVAAEWPAVKAQLAAKLSRPWLDRPHSGMA